MVAVHGKFADELRSHVHGRPWIADYLNKEDDVGFYKIKLARKINGS